MPRSAPQRAPARSSMTFRSSDQAGRKRLSFNLDLEAKAFSTRDGGDISPSHDLPDTFRQDRWPNNPNSVGVLKGTVVLIDRLAGQRHSTVTEALENAEGCTSSQSFGVTGRRTRKRVPPGADANDTSPRHRSTTILRTISSPSPVPLPTSFVVKNGS